MNRVTICLAAAALGLSLSACTRHPHLAEDFGESHRANASAMIANPNAGTQPTPEGLDPQTGEYVLENYAEGQKAQEHPRPKQRRGAGILVGEISD